MSRSSGQNQGHTSKKVYLSVAKTDGACLCNLKHVNHGSHQVMHTVLYAQHFNGMVVADLGWHTYVLTVGT